MVAVVDDDRSIRAATDSLLRSRGYAVCTFPSASEFLQSRELAETVCVITDVRMPAIDGIELQAMLRARGSSLPVIFVTAFPEESTRARAIRGGASGYLTKPFDAPTLMKCVEAALDGRRGVPD
ncbi:MAG TPA: response regulator [Chloroflexota bacterium]|nr:response regulator [Chloroflexota bacterium]